MANWKERGEVPDSDDDDDLDLESQPLSNINNEELATELPVDEYQAPEEPHLKGTGQEEDGDPTIGPPYDYFQSTSEVAAGQDGWDILAPEVEPSSSTIRTPEDARQPSPDSPRVFTLPTDFLDDNERILSDVHEPKEPGCVPVPVIEDEISQSYVRITSQASSPLSSPPRSQISSTRDKGRPSQDQRLDQDIQQQILGEQSMSISPGSPAYRRTFRQRNPIQLHPYALEENKYMKDFKSRGLKPIRVAQSQDERRKKARDGPSPDPNSQDMDFEMEESQQMDVDNSLPSSPPLPQPRRNRDKTEDVNEALVIGSDDEFPDMDELLRAPRPTQHTAISRRRIKTYTSKSQRRPLTKFQTKSSHATANNINDIFDIPASPTTSSPFATTSRIVRKPMSRTLSLSSQEATPTWLGHDEPEVRMVADLPTPATSTTKSASNLVVIESDNDIDDPFATDNDLSPAAASSSDESIQIRRVGKKIRGVLPASHLRLDQSRKKQTAPSRTQRQSFSVSPAELPPRRGVALARPLDPLASPTTATNTGMHFLSDDSDVENDENDENGFVMEDDAGNAFNRLFQREGSAEEDDRIDPMLPSQKRKRNVSSGKSVKKRRVGIPKNRGSGFPRQPKITEHLEQSRQPTKPNKNLNRKRKNKDSSSRKNRPHFDRSTRPPPPRLSILDVADMNSQNRLEVPQFVRVAARTVRSKSGQGKQSPSKKFIRLANREDTFDAQSVLEDWRGGRIQPRILDNLPEAPPGTTRSPLQPISSNQQRRLQPPMSKARHSSDVLTRPLEMPRRIVVSKSKQRSMNDFVTSEEPMVTRYEAPPIERRKALNHPQPIIDKPHRRSALSARPAQLEASEMESSRQNLASAFKSTKKTLDAIYRSALRRRGPQNNIQLGRFLADDDIVAPSTETPRESSKFHPIPPAQPLHQLPRRRKLLPERVDVGAARYRQPSEPLILESTSPTFEQDVSSRGSKLQGLGKFGTKYSLHFDIFPLQSGIYFHESTFIGSGRLSKAVNGCCVQPGGIRQHTSLRVDDKYFEWGPWNPVVSSEIGVCFDLILDQILSSSTTTSTLDPISVATFIVDYVQKHLSFPESHGQTNFLTRLIEVLQDISSRVKRQLSAMQQTRAQWIELLNRCLLIGLAVLQMARAHPGTSSESFQVEDVLKELARTCVDLLLSDGLGGLRKLYDDLQYLSFRERGIRNDQVAVQSWVIMIQVLDSARIPRGSFWDIVNLELLGKDTKNTSDARVMEQLWYSMFSLLPLCEFDDFGVVKPGRRRYVSFDNWTLPQQVLKGVFALYRSNPRQSPGFNEYCRTLMSRCHYLMTIWSWWKCTGIIGAIFDFFASQKLAHLRNEEVYDSPRFLRELDTDTSLEIDPEDRCFHIFLKIVALAIKHMHKSDDIKSMRNLVPRLLPNHDRQYAKEEAIYQRELASLRNHHDLLCTLYWAAPQDQRPNLSLIQELVVPDRSHKEACLINIRAWENLARFAVTQLSNPILYQPLALWQDEFSAKLAEQYLGIESDVRLQAEALEKTDRAPVTEGLLKQTILTNKRSTLEALRVMVKVMDHTVKSAKSAQFALQAFNPELLWKASHPDSWVEDGFSGEMMQDCVDSICRYMDQTDHLEPICLPLPDSTYSTDSESQGSLEMNLNMDRVEMIYRLQPKILPLLRIAMKHGLQIESSKSLSSSLVSDLVSCWSSLVLKLTESAMNLGDFLVKGPNAVFHQRGTSSKLSAYWPLFLSELIGHRGLEDLKVPGFDIGLEWLLALSRPRSRVPSAPSMVNALTTKLQAKGHYLAIWPHRVASSAVDIAALEGNKLPNHTLIKTAIDIMRHTLLSQANVDLVFGNKTQREAEATFAAILKEVMESIKNNLEAMTPGSDELKEYVGFVQLIISIIRSYASEIRLPLEFFGQPSAHYWPEDSDPNLFAAGIISYSLRLVEHPRRTAPILFHYLYSGWRRDLIQSSIGRHMSYLKKGLKRLEFINFLMIEFLPAALHVGFHSPGGWVLCATYLPVLSSRLNRILQRGDSESAFVFEPLINIVKIILNGISTRYVGSGLIGVNPEYTTMVSVGCQFWFSVALPMRQYADQHPEVKDMATEVTTPLTRFIFQTCQPRDEDFGATLWEIERLEVKNGDHIENFVSCMTQDIKDRWDVHRDRMGADIGGTGAHEGNKTKVDFRQVVGVRPSLVEMLEIALPTLEPTQEDTIPLALKVPTDRLLRDVYC